MASQSDILGAPHPQRGRPVNQDHYCYILFRENGQPFYVGKGRGNRAWQHIRQVKRGRSHKDNIIAAMIDSGIDIPVVKVAEGLTSEAAALIEIAFISAIGRWPNGPLTNLTRGGDGSVDMAPETRAKISAARKGRKAAPGVGAKISAANVGKKRTKEQIENIRAARSKWKITPENRAKMNAARKGIKLSQEHRAKLSIAMSARRLSAEHKAKIGDAHRGRALPRDQVEKMRASKRGKTLTSEHRAKLSAAGRGRKKTAEHRAKICAAQSGRPRNPISAAKAVATQRTPEYRAACSLRTKELWARRRLLASSQ